MPRAEAAITNKKTASPKDLIWAGSVQWESGHGSPTYAYVFGLDEHAVDTALEHLHSAVVKMEFHENYVIWVPWLGHSEKTAPEEILEGIEESIKIRGPSRHQLDEMWFEGAHMPEVLKRIETEPLVIDLPIKSFDDLAPYCQNPDALRAFVVGNGYVVPILDEESTKALFSNTTKESEMNRQKRPEPKRRTMRRRATARQIREEVRARLERRAEARSQGRPAGLAKKRTITAERRAEMEREKRREQRLAALEERKEKRMREQRLAALKEHKEKKAREQRLAALKERRAERKAAEARVARLKELREARAKKVAAKPAPEVKKAEAKKAPAKKYIYVKAGNSANMPEGYYELDEAATKKYQAHLKHKEAAAADKK